jgi:hypothetical protein
MGSDFLLKVIPNKVGSDVIVKYHYTHARPPGTAVTFGAFAGQEFVGVVTFGSPAGVNIWKSVPGLNARHELCELTRLWVKDAAPRFYESRMISRALKMLATQARFRAVVSYADPLAGHVGTVYQAANWVFAGQSAGGEKVDLGDGVLLHKMTATDQFRTNNIAEIRRQHPAAQMVKVPGKYQYIYALDQSLWPTFRAVAKPYPKRVQ